MGGSPKKPQMLKQSPAPSPVPLDIEALEKERAKRRQKIRQKGRAGTLLTGGLGTTGEDKGTLLGGRAV